MSIDDDKNMTTSKSSLVARLLLFLPTTLDYTLHFITMYFIFIIQILEAD